MFWPAAGCTIDTRRPFRMSASYVAADRGGGGGAAADDGGAPRLERIAVALTQDGGVFAFDVCAADGGEYNGAMSGALARGMVMVFSLWGDSFETMSWLDDMTGCAGDCDLAASSVTFSNFLIADEDGGR